MDIFESFRNFILSHTNHTECNRAFHSIFTWSLTAFGSNFLNNSTSSRHRLSFLLSCGDPWIIRDCTRDSLATENYLFCGHVLYEAPLRPAEHLAEAVLRRHHVEVIRVEDQGVLLQERLVVLHCSLWKESQSGIWFQIFYTLYLL